MGRTSDEGVPALQNEDVTGMTEERQEKVIRESGRGGRNRAEEELSDKKQDQPARTKPD